MKHINKVLRTLVKAGQAAQLRDDAVLIATSSPAIPSVTYGEVKAAIAELSEIATIKIDVVEANEAMLEKAAIIDRDGTLRLN